VPLGFFGRLGSRNLSATTNAFGPRGTDLHVGHAPHLQRSSRSCRELRLNLRALWKDADPDIPILKEAKAEYAKLQ
jgi:hypothetical protein